MISFIQATAILSILLAFGVDQPTIDNVRNILIPPVVNVAPTTITPVQVIQTPVVQNAPIYFGSTIPTPPLPVIIKPMPNWTINVKTPNGTDVKKGIPMRFEVEVLDKNGVYSKTPVTVTTDSPDMPASFVINKPYVAGGSGSADYFCIVPGWPSTGQGCPDGIATPGTYNFTFTVEDVSKEVQVTVE